MTHRKPPHPVPTEFRGTPRDSFLRVTVRHGTTPVTPFNGPSIFPDLSVKNPRIPTPENWFGEAPAPALGLRGRVRAIGSALRSRFSSDTRSPSWTGKRDSSEGVCTPAPILKRPGGSAPILAHKLPLGDGPRRLRSPQPYGSWTLAMVIPVTEKPRFGLILKVIKRILTPVGVLSGSNRKATYAGRTHEQLNKRCGLQELATPCGLAYCLSLDS